ncbi:hypothetical protein FRC03_003079 [Tulasnella sp. 419]|nr:hypothetical protein FRC03_003079 [Tulasnella sp. 419]
MSTPNVYTLQKSPTFKEYGRCSVEVPDTKRDGQTGHYRNPKWSQLKGDLEVGTVADLFESGLAQAKTMNCLGHRPIKSQEPLTFEAEYVWETYEQIDTRRRAVGSALVELFTSGRLTAGELETVGLWSINRPEWQIVDIALQSYRKVTVSLYDTLGPNSVEYIINHAETSIVFTSEKNIQALLDLADKCAVLKMVVSFDTLEASAKTKFVETAKEKGIEFLEFSEFEAIGAAKLVDPIQPGQQDVSTICYTSGTTATPKGVVLTHKNLASAVLSNCHSMKVPRHYVMISYLPLAHIYGRLAELAALTNGGSIGYYTGNPVNLLSDCQALKPHFFPGVPRVLNKIYQVAMANTRLPGLKGMDFLNNFRSFGLTFAWQDSSSGKQSRPKKLVSRHLAKLDTSSGILSSSERFRLR